MLLSSTVALSSDCRTSKEFFIPRSQRLAGTLVDPAGVPIPGFGIQLLSSNRIVRKPTTNRDGEYDFGKVVMGRYRIRLTSIGFCAPDVTCDRDHCVVTPKLRLKGEGVWVY